MRPEETDWLLVLARDSPAIAGVVGWADFTTPDFSARLEGGAAIAQALAGEDRALDDLP